MKKLIELNADDTIQINELKAQVRRLEQDKEALLNEIQIARTEVGVSLTNTGCDCERAHWFNT